MYRLSHDYAGDEGLKTFLDKTAARFEETPPVAVLFHLFCDQCNGDLANRLVGIISERIPQALIVGGSTNGSIFDGELMSGGNVDVHVAIACDVFEDPDAKLEVLQYRFDYESQDETIRALIQAVAERPWVKAVESVSTMVNVNTPELCSEASCLPSGIAWFGGCVTGPDDSDINSGAPFVLSSAGELSNRGIVFVLYGGDNLHVMTQATVGWKPLGMPFAITALDRAELVELDGKPAFDVYHRYLKIANDENFFHSSVLFPFAFDHGDLTILKTPTKVNDDGSLTMTSDISGERRTCRLAYGDPATVLHDIKENARAMQDFAPQSILAFSCSARRFYWGDDYVSRETRPFAKIAPLVGFFTAGEFIRNGDDVTLCNVTLVIAGLREGEPEDRELIDLQVEDAEFSRQMKIVHILSAFVGETAADAQKALDQMEVMARTDGLTQLNNRRQIELILEHVVEDYNKSFGASHGSPATMPPVLVMLDLDDFKRVNDIFGHKAGDIVLSTLGAILKEHFSELGFIAEAGRWGGEEFFIVFDGCSFEDAHDLVEDLRVRFSETLFEKSGQHTMSIGITQVRLGESPDEACIRVDEALYEAKRQGKNRIVVV